MLFPDVLQADQVDVWLYPQPLDCLIPLPQRFWHAPMESMRQCGDWSRVFFVPSFLPSQNQA